MDRKSGDSNPGLLGEMRVGYHCAASASPQKVFFYLLPGFGFECLHPEQWWWLKWWLIGPWFWGNELVQACHKPALNELHWPYQASVYGSQVCGEQRPYSCPGPQDLKVGQNGVHKQSWSASRIFPFRGWANKWMLVLKHIVFIFRIVNLQAALRKNNYLGHLGCPILFSYTCTWIWTKHNYL